MNLIPKSLFICVSSLMIFVCSQDGAQAQSDSVPVEDSQILTNWTVDATKSTLGFSGSQSGEEFSGTFKKFEVQIKFEPDDPENGKIRVVIDMTSVDAGGSERNEALPGKEWFATKAFPNAVFKSRTIKKIGDNEYEAIGDLTIKEVTRPLTLPFTLEIIDVVAKANAQFAINRSDFGVGTGMWKSEDWVAHQVQVIIEINAVKTTK